MRCESCPLQRPGGDRADAALLAQTLDCTDCPLEHGALCPPETAAALVGQVRRLVQLVAQQKSQLNKSRNESRELREQARHSEERVMKLEQLQKAATRDSDVELRAKMELLAQQQAAILLLSTPIIAVKERTLVLPLIGNLDDDRAINLTESLLAEITRSRAKLAIIDMTGVADLDDKSARHLLMLGRAVRLLGAEILLCGLRSHVATALVSSGVELGGLRTARSLQEALRD